MVQNMPESSFELSLRDIVDDRTNMQEGEKKIEKKKCVERSRMVRSQNMDIGVFLLKMFLPACLSAKKKSTSGNCSRASHRPSFDRSEKPMDKECWNVMFLVSRRKINNCNSNNSSRNSGSIHNRTPDSPTYFVKAGMEIYSCITPVYLSSEHLSKSRRHIWSIC
ncbi:Pentatricopeptide repeat-containing protein [Heracleum sosnowskyi]|uniref:Pentatricopeptide repeat-containing protein n=1 Tax=Heracleum sosnowskyi TaxID=360622 RepID=A0AAD8N0Z6_9APIA|nr:Pentatricopeptide repeat-containing protein [Heracleum sosnowskyi]KAK1397725.1 Pentatricopeptide repeat-containing protein [Heracleum sosnowskyi]